MHAVAGTLIAAALLSANAAQAQDADGVCRVTTAGTAAASGASWATPMDLQGALAAAGCAEIWVAQGVYKPAVPADPPHVTPAEQAATFAVRPGVAVYGGFAGNEASRAARDPAARLTVLSGDIDGNDTANAQGVDESWTDIVGSNSAHVVTLSGVAAPIGADTVLDGFTITAGAAPGPIANPSSFPNDTLGGGLLCDGNGAGSMCSPTLSRLAFRGNQATLGGAIANTAQGGGSASPIVDQATFTGNSAAMGNLAFGAGAAASPTITNSTFSNNAPASFDSGLSSFAQNGGSASPTLASVTFSSNGSSALGNVSLGAGSSASPVLTDVTFRDNINPYSPGAAMLNQVAGDGRVQSTLTRAIFTGNQVQNQPGGGAIANEIGIPGSGQSNTGVIELDFSDAVFAGNSASTNDIGGAHGGAIVNVAHGGAITLTFANATFSDNHADSAGAIYNWARDGGSAAMTFANATFSGNTGGGSGLGGAHGDAVQNVAGASSEFGVGAGPATASAAFTNATFSGNVSAPGAAAIGNEANGDGASASLKLLNAILWGSAGASGPQVFFNGIAGVSAAIDHSLLQGGCSAFPSIPAITCSSVIEGDPLLGPLQNNGGFTSTMLPSASSPALNGGTAAGAPAVDQRGVARPTSGSVDIGAVEVATTLVPATLAVAVSGSVSAGASPAPGGGGIVGCDAAGGSACSATYFQGQQVTLAATPAAHWHFVQWGGACGGSAPSAAVTLGASASCTAAFAIDEVAITASASGSGGAITPASASVPYGGSASFALQPEPGFGVGQVSGCGGTLSGATYTVENVTVACTISASFVGLPPATVTASVDGGGGGIAPAQQTVPSGTAARLTLTPEPGQQVASVGGTCGGTLSGNTFTTDPVRADCTVVAKFRSQASSVAPIPTLDWRGLLALAVLLSTLAGAHAGRSRRRR